MNLTSKPGNRLRVEYANQSEGWLDTTVEGIVQIGNYKATWEFWVGENGNEIILGLPFLQSIQITNLNWRNEEMEFRVLHDNSYHHWTRKHTDKRNPKTNNWQIATRAEMIETETTTEVFKINIQLLATEKQVTGTPTGTEKVNTLQQQLVTAGGSDKQLTALLLKYRDRFEPPTGIPI
jgi:hypothetical protein